jgi:catechol 2,3-dioxygenase-like lactoylglutathione lyase family enzyme
MLHHLSLGALDIDRAARFYDAVLAPLGYVRVWSDLRPGEDEQAVGYGPPGSGDKLCIKQVTAPVPVIPAGATTGPRACARTTASTTTQPSSSTPRGIDSRRCATRWSHQPEHAYKRLWNVHLAVWSRVSAVSIRRREAR